MESKSRYCTGAYFTNTGGAGENVFLNDSREFQDVELTCSGHLSHVPSQPGRCSKSSWYAEPRPKPAT